MPESSLLLFFIFAASLFGLMKSADVLVDGSTAVARRLKVSDLVIGLTVVALGTSLPEFVVSVNSSLKGLGSMAAGNVLGSNIANIGLVIGATCLIFPIVTPANLRKTDIGILAGLLLTFPLCLFLTGSIESGFIFPRWSGYLMLFFLGYFIFSMFKVPSEELEDDEDEIDQPMSKAIGLTILGLLFLLVSGHYTVESAIGIARSFGISEATIGVTIVAIGTSLPELVAGVVAAKKGKVDMGVGNVIGSNLMNLGLVLGTSVAIAPIGLTTDSVWDGFVMLAINFIFLALILRKKKPQLSRAVGGIFLIGYVLYLIFVSARV